MSKIIVIICKHGTTEQVQNIEQLTSFLRKHGKSEIELTVDE